MQEIFRAFITILLFKIFSSFMIIFNMNTKTLDNFQTKKGKGGKVESISMKIEDDSKPSTNEIATIPHPRILINVKEQEENKIEDQLGHNNQDFEEATYIYGLHMFSVLGLCILFSSPVILIPQHDAIKSPRYWYELLITYSLTDSIQRTLKTILENHFLLQIERLASPTIRFIIWLLPTLGFVVIYSCLYFLWTYELGYNFPMPLGSFIPQVIFFPTVLMIWNLFPKDMRIEKFSRRRLKYFVWYLLWVQLPNNMYNSLLVVLKKMPSKAQPIMAIVLPLMRSIDNKILTKLLSQCSFGEHVVVESYANIISNVNFLLYVTISISGNTNDVTTFCILMVDVIGNLYHCYVIIRLHRKVGNDDGNQIRIQQEKESTIKMIALSEVLEILVPLSYTITFIVAYYGPNTMILDKIRHDYWNNVPSENIGNLLVAEILLFSVDFGCLCVTTLCLWYFCRINFLTQFCRALKKYWFLIAVVAGALISKVCFILI